MVITIYLITGHVDEQLLLQWKIYIFFWEDGGGGGGVDAVILEEIDLHLSMQFVPITNEM
jgi:hypothetical protein